LLCIAFLCGALLCIALHCFALIAFAFLFIALLCFALLCSSLLCFALQTKQPHLHTTTNATLACLQTPHVDVSSSFCGRIFDIMIYIKHN
jgi:hypothetical protein